ncbi:hypothetical protein Syun_020045 [Stephania yunnanensis]|uniref:Uncharacterized protein n=1 Tax=Stephania yunnanensis TaxID=152371 RepID=A0AAP0IVA5_9MAGN
MLGLGLQRSSCAQLGLRSYGSVRGVGTLIDKVIPFLLFIKPARSTLEECGLAKEATMATPRHGSFLACETLRFCFLYGTRKGSNPLVGSRTIEAAPFGGRGNGGGSRLRVALAASRRGWLARSSRRFSGGGGLRFLSGVGLDGAAPPCPMPTQGWARPPASSRGPGMVGPRSQQQAYPAFMAPSFNGPSSSSLAGSYAP